MTSNKETESKTDKNWRLLFEKYNILEKVEKKGFFEISSKQINEFRESRLMTKFDHKRNLPKLFINNKLSILPLTRGTYIIARFEAYQEINYSKSVETIPIPKRYDLESLDYDNLYSESAALNCAFVSGIIKDVLGEECEFTINGRMSSKNFEFFIKEDTAEYGKRKIDVKNSQCEIDAGFESENKLALIEAKNTKCDDFLIRQMYYPYRLWKNKISKEIVPIFMTFSNDKFSFFIYDFKDPNNYNSLELVEQKDYIIAPEEITFEDIKNVLNEVKIKSEPKIPFPQANSFERIIDFLGLLVEEDMRKEDMTLNYDFNERQSDYYFNGCNYLGLVERSKDDEDYIVFSLNKKGLKIMNLNHREKNLSLVKLILEHKTFNETLKLYFKKLETPTKEEIVKIMKSDNLFNVNSDSTYLRRSSTVLKWIEWIIDLVED
ncbi:MAG: translation elongation factor [Nanoarchaeota archaeon]|nr:translation elongation factor [Nanoarchaeota archaeon]